MKKNQPAKSELTPAKPEMLDTYKHEQDVSVYHLFSKAPKLSRVHINWLVFCACLVINLLFLITRGAWNSDLGGDPDEAAHAVTSLMVRDYLAGGLTQPPMKFASAYYDSFPKVALGHYPPAYYLLTAPLLLSWPSLKVFFILQAVLLAALAAMVVRHLINQMSIPLAVSAGISVNVLPIGLKQSQLVMSDLLLAVVCLAAAVSWGRYLQGPSLRRALTWGCIAAAAILTKGAGMGLCLMPPLATLFSGRWRLLRTWSWWSSALPVALLAGPWMLYTTSISKEGMTQMSPIQYLVEAVPFYLNTTHIEFGWLMTALAFCGMAAGIKASLKRGACTPESAAIVALAIGMSAVLLLVPVGLTSRYLLTLAPIIVITAAYGLHFLIPLAFHRSCWIKPLIMCIAAFLPLISNGLPKKEVQGFSAAVHRANLSLADSQTSVWLIASDPRGEGAVIAAAAFACPKRTPSLLRVYRGSKELATSDWMGRGYQAAFVNNDQLLEKLDKLQISRVFVDLSVPADRKQPHEHQLLAALQSADDRWHLAFEQTVTRRPGETGMLRVYQRNPPITTNPQN